MSRRAWRRRPSDDVWARDRWRWLLRRIRALCVAFLTSPVVDRPTVLSASRAGPTWSDVFGSFLPIVGRECARFGFVACFMIPPSSIVRRGSRRISAVLRAGRRRACHRNAWALLRGANHRGALTSKTGADLTEDVSTARQELFRRVTLLDGSARIPWMLRSRVPRLTRAA